MLNSTLILTINNDSTFDDLIRGFFAGIVKFLYKLFSGAIDLMYDLAIFDYGLDKYIDSIGNKIFNILIIFMLFKVTFSIMTYLVDPESFTDNSKGFQGIIKRVLIALVLLISINPLFNLLSDLQVDIIDSEVIASVFANTNAAKTIKIDEVYGYGVKMHSDCEEGRYVYTFSKGDHMALLLLSPFIQPYSVDEVGEDYYSDMIDAINGKKVDDSEHPPYCGQIIEDNKSITYVSGGSGKVESLKNAIPGPNSAEGFMYAGMYNDIVKDNIGDGGKSAYIYDFNYFFALAAGFFALLIVISFCFDVVVRSLTLILLKLVAPVPIISYISPKEKSSAMLGIWLKKLGSVWASLFIRIAVLSIGISFIGAACNELSNKQNNVSTIMQVFIILGILMFVKKMPGLLEELIPGLKLGNGFELNPFKKIKNGAILGDKVTGAAGAAAGLGLMAASQAGSNAVAFGRNKQNLKKAISSESDPNKKAKLQRRYNALNAGRFLSTTAGGIVGGAKNGMISGFKTGTTGSMNVAKNIKDDLEKGNLARNNRTAINDYNRDVKATGTGEKYGFFERHFTENVDRITGTKNEYGGYGAYNKKIEDLTREIENNDSKENSLRTALAQFCTNNNYDQLGLEDIHQRFKSSGNLNTAINQYITANGLSNSVAPQLTVEYNNVSQILTNIDSIDDDTKSKKTTRKGYQENLDARDKVKKDK